jgi:hypothetical protein
MKERERAYLSSLTSTFGMKCSSCLLFFTFLQRWALHLPQALGPTSHRALCYSSLGAIPDSRDGLSGKWGEGVGRGEVGRRGGVKVGRRDKFWGWKGGWKIPGQGKRMCFWFIPKTAWTASSWTGALLAAGSLQPKPGTPSAQVLTSIWSGTLTHVFNRCKHCPDQPFTSTA